MSLQVIRADPADLAVLGQVIAEAFHHLAASQWLIADPGARRQVFPGYFRLYVEHVMAAGLACTTADRAAVALWLPAGPGAPGQSPGYDQRLAAATAPGPAGSYPSTVHWTPAIPRACITWPSWLSGQTARARAPVPHCYAPTSRHSTTTACRPTWKRPTCVPAVSTCATATPTTARRSTCPAGP
jgi:hypothetical protein